MPVNPAGRSTEVTCTLSSIPGNTKPRELPRASTLNPHPDANHPCACFSSLLLSLWNGIIALFSWCFGAAKKEDVEQDYLHGPFKKVMEDPAGFLDYYIIHAIELDGEFIQAILASPEKTADSYEQVLRKIKGQPGCKFLQEDDFRDVVWCAVGMAEMRVRDNPDQEDKILKVKLSLDPFKFMEEEPDLFAEMRMQDRSGLGKKLANFFVLNPIQAEKGFLKLKNDLVGKDREYGSHCTLIRDGFAGLEVQTEEYVAAERLFNRLI